jgi:PEP-CTERM motif
MRCKNVSLCVMCLACLLWMPSVTKAGSLLPTWVETVEVDYSFDTLTGIQTIETSGGLDGLSGIEVAARSSHAPEGRFVYALVDYQQSAGQATMYVTSASHNLDFSDQNPVELGAGLYPASPQPPEIDSIVLGNTVGGSVNVNVSGAQFLSGFYSLSDAPAVTFTWSGAAGGVCFLLSTPDVSSTDGQTEIFLSAQIPEPSSILMMTVGFAGALVFTASRARQARNSSRVASAPNNACL